MPEPVRLPKRFYQTVSLTTEEGGFTLALDGKPARTPARSPLTLPTPGLGEAIADEWRAQRDVIDPVTMPLTKLANTAIDGVAPRRVEVIADIARYGRSDLLVYRAGEPDRLVAAQAAAWDPILAAAREHLGLRFILSEGVTFVDQPTNTTARVEAAVAADPSPFRLAGLHVLTSLSGSVLIALAVDAGHLPPDIAWAAAHVDELYQESLWGTDHEATLRRAARERDFKTALRMIALAKDPRSPDIIKYSLADRENG